MLHLLDESIEAFLRSTVPLDPSEVAVSFDAPDRQWAAQIVQPTVNVYLWDVHRDADATRAGMETATRGSTGIRRRPLPRMQVRYILSAWTSAHRDEHQLLGEVMLAVLRNPSLEPPALKAPLDLVTPFPSIKLAAAGSGKAANDFWKAIDGQLKPSLELQVVLPVDPGFGTELAEPPAEVEVTTADRTGPARSVRSRIGGVVEDPAAVGRVVRTRRGVGTVEEGGRYLVPGEPGDEVVLELADEHVVLKPQVD